MAKKEEVQEKTYYKLGPKATVFWDENQPVNKKILPGQVVDLEETMKVTESKLHKGIIEVSEKEYTDYQKMKEETEEEIENVNTGNRETDAAIKNAIKVHSEGVAALDQAKTLNAEADKKNKEADAKLAEAQKLAEANSKKPEGSK